MMLKGPWRRRRTLCTTHICVVFGFFSVVWVLSLWSGSSSSPTDFYRKYYRDRDWTTTDELRGLVYFTSSFPGRSLDPRDGHLPYTFGKTTRRDANVWKEKIRAIDTVAPVVIFSKTYCPFSTRAKELFAKLDTQPKPLVIEVDLREDTDIVKNELSRLTGRATFPNILLRSKSIGGFDDVQSLYESGQLLTMLRDGHIVVHGA
ncbi:thioredoxin-like protein [Cantharellus anzutake]|uniref:thioredoxin-like protein n=1 Tax=Cantharellus anzutake TaxID=1750568 RepID=UPI0019053C15|nr:thioredoxin-like protein [Cantharellus anzutake]KAF8326548.1 thioredoxin-like protein [Cantharellus anzutake]